MGSRTHYTWGIFRNAVRRPQLTEEQRSKVVINQDEWPEMFKDYDPENPYKNAPLFIEGMTTFDYFMWGFEIMLVWHLYELVFPKGI